jgi:eukaryotic-like serine/threonine-protein kinase
MTVPVRFHVLELATGCLDELIAHVDKLPWEERLRLFRDVVFGVHQMHCHAVMHRDLKSSNCLLFDERFRTVLVKVNDLGRSRDLTQAAMASAFHYRMGRGDPSFAPPEMLWLLGTDEALCHRLADLYGLGSILFELITGQGITAVTLFPRYSVVQGDHSLADDARRRQYDARIDEIRSWYETAYLLASTGIPPEIRPLTLKLLRQLCDPSPRLRLPRLAPGRRVQGVTDLNWLLTRVDILTKTLSQAARQRSIIEKKRAAK